MGKQRKPTAPGIPIALDRPRRLLVDFNALAAIEEKLDANTLDPAFWQTFPRNAGDLRVFLWACLRHEDPDLDLDGAGRLINQRNMEAIRTALDATAGASMSDGGEGDGQAGDGAKKKRRRTG